MYRISQQKKVYSQFIAIVGARAGFHSWIRPQSRNFLQTGTGAETNG
jgi:hypothetical protein